MPTNTMRILVTGASGDVGGYITQYLLDQGHTIHAADIVPLPLHPHSPQADFHPIGPRGLYSCGQATVGSPGWGRAFRGDPEPTDGP